MGNNNIKTNEIGTIYEESTHYNENHTSSKVNKTFENETKDNKLDNSQNSEFDNKVIFQTHSKINLGENEQNVLTDIKDMHQLVISQRDSKKEIDTKQI